ncbi:MAG: TonB family protein [Deltaproteobacteria bacterium]|nr:TonB family protein [Deltaproteobacteria bacterium]
MQTQQRSHDYLLLGFIVLSLLLHLLAASQLPLRRLLEAPPRQREPLVVEVLPPQETRRFKPRELDLPETPPQKRDTRAKRLGLQDHVAEQETAPKGKDFEDRDRIAPRSAELVPKKALPRLPAVPKLPSEPKPSDLPVPTVPIPLNPNLSREFLMKFQQEARRKEREDAKEGDVVWLDTEHDVLISFFRRFRNNIYRVWNYPVVAAQRGEQGICRLQVTVDRGGVVKKVQVLQGSGFDALDREAVKAVRMGSPYGELPAEFKGDTLHLVADFHYVLSNAPAIGKWGYRQTI